MKIRIHKSETPSKGINGIFFEGEVYCHKKFIAENSRFISKEAQEEIVKLMNDKTVFLKGYNKICTGLPHFAIFDLEDFFNGNLEVLEEKNWQ